MIGNAYAIEQTERLGAHNYRIRLAPPLINSEPDLKRAAGQIKSVFRSS